MFNRHLNQSSLCGGSDVDENTVSSGSSQTHADRLCSFVKLKQEEKAERTAERGFCVPPTALLYSFTILSLGSKYKWIKKSAACGVEAAFLLLSKQSDTKMYIFFSSYLSCFSFKVNIFPGGNLPLIPMKVGREKLEGEVGTRRYKGL